MTSKGCCLEAVIKDKVHGIRTVPALNQGQFLHVPVFLSTLHK